MFMQKAPPTPPAATKPSAPLPTDDITRRLNDVESPNFGPSINTPPAAPAHRPPPAKTEPGEFTRVFAAQPRLDSPGAGAPRPGGNFGIGTPAAGVPTVGHPGGSEFTRALKRVELSEVEAMRAASAPTPAEAAKPEPAAPKPPARVPVVLIVIGVTVVLAIALLLYVSLSSK
jgi:hypothetical protein